MRKDLTKSPMFAALGFSNRLERKNYNADIVREKAKNKWFDIWESLGIPSYQNFKFCPICKISSFKIVEEQEGTFYCDHCKTGGDGMMLLQLFHSWEFHEALDRVGRILKLRPREVSP